MAMCGGLGGVASGVAVEVDVGPVQGSGFFGADPGEQAEHDVGVHEVGGAADVFEAGAQPLPGARTRLPIVIESPPAS
jgi:hypothetical protein